MFNILKQPGFLSLTIALMAISGCSTMNSRVLTEAEYNASLPEDVYPDSRSRLPIVNRDALDEESRVIYDRFTSPNSTSLAGIQGPGGLRLHANADKSPSKIDSRIRELVRLVISREMDQQFEWTMHEPVALKVGLSSDIIDTIRFRRPLRGIPDMEAAIIQMGREVFQQHQVSSQTYSRLKNHFGNRDLIEIAQQMSDGMNSFILLFLFDVHLPHDREGLLPIR